MATFAERLRDLRNEKGLTQAELADQLGVAMNTVSIWELGKRMPEAKTITQIARYFMVTEKYLLGQSDIGDLASMIAELKRLKVIETEAKDDEAFMLTQISMMFGEFSEETQKSIFDSINGVYEFEREHGRLRSQQEDES